MKASDLRLGNFAGVCYEDTLVADQVIVLEPGVVHLSNRKYADDERDIIGVPLCEEWLKKFNFQYEPTLARWEYKNIIIKKISYQSDNYWIWQSKAGVLKIAFVHELQNLLHTLTEVN